MAGEAPSVNSASTKRAYSGAASEERVAGPSKRVRRKDSAMDGTSAPETRLPTAQQTAGSTGAAPLITPQNATRSETAKDTHMAELAGLRAQLLDMHQDFTAIYRRAASARASGSDRASAPVASAPQAPAPPEIKQEAESVALFFQRSIERPAQLQRETSLADANARLRDDVERLRAQAAAAQRTIDEERDAALEQEVEHHAELARLHERIAEQMGRNAELQAEVRVCRSSSEGRVERGRREP
ncbi:hypothetical protein PsYK624_154260 [Phanerochaete sordida]|uniref:Uncharacterized protein n=1 Tax=Phanerochaete sordida TaxID=48140 RepID=A0A9P3LL05_9APHY|nr:hypothetical protein PsYK624_154260 [Phanerochaete sordida]